MCLAVPGKILQVQSPASEMATGRVDFGGVQKEICLAFTPDVQPGQFVLVHAGFAITIIDEGEANRIFDLLASLGDSEIIPD